MGEKRNAYRILVGKSEIKIPLGRPGRRWEIMLRWILQMTGGGCMDRIQLAQDRDQGRALISTVINLWVSQKLGHS
jgi:hypothetical protein